jgi:hypothetical protein
VDLLHQDRETWEMLVRAQRAHFEKAVAELDYVRIIGARLDG